MEFLKKSLCILLILSFVLAVGCNNESNDEKSKDAFSEQTDAQSEILDNSETSETSDISDTSDTSGSEDDENNTNDTDEKEEISDSTDYTSKIDNLLSGTDDRNQNNKNILQGLKYTTTVNAHPDYPDNGAILTDGKKDTVFSKQHTWAGYSISTEDFCNKIEFDLGKNVKGLMDFSVWALVLDSYAIYMPKSVSVYVAGDDKDFVKVGTAHAPNDFSSQGSPYEFVIKLQKAVEARYVCFEIKTTRGWCFIGEISATGYDKSFEPIPGSNGNINEYYKFEEIPEITVPEYWNETDADYNVDQNLIAGKRPSIYASGSVSVELITNWYNTTSPYCLTDKQTATVASINDNAWYHITRGDTREITWDLKKTSAVKSFSVGFLRDKGPGVNFPRNVKIKISENGKDWQTIFFNETLSSEKESYIIRLKGDFDKTYKARYVQLYFIVDTHVYLDEVEIFGSKNIEGARDVEPDNEGSGNQYDGEFLMPEDFCDVNNMLLSYHCLVGTDKKSTEGGLITVDEYLPHVAYLDKDGNIKDTFFDAYLYLPYTNFVHAQGTSDFGRSADGWRTYVADMYHEDRNINALEQCAEKVYGELGITEQKLKVFTSILYTFTTLYDGSKNPFGDIDGDGVNEDFSNIEDRKKAIKWIMDEELKRFEEGNYKYLEFCGYYWFEEQISYSDPHELELIEFAVDYAHKLGYKIFWIPYKTAAGVDEWETLGFDAACLQPNYMFGSAPTSDVLYETAERAKNLGMCVELEFNNPNNTTEARKYIEYLIAGAETGYMNAVKMYYQVGVPGAIYETYASKNPDVRKIYDDTYLFAKEKYVPVLPKNVIISETPLDFVYTPNENFEGKLDISHLKDAMGVLAVSLSPKYGSVQLNEDGSFVYFPAENYCGNDYFEIFFDLGYGVPVPTRINLKCE